MGKVYIFDHPLIQHKLSLMRDVHTGAKDSICLIPHRKNSGNCWKKSAC